MKTTGIGKVLALTGALAGAGTLTGCAYTPQESKQILNESYLVDTLNITTQELRALNNSIKLPAPTGISEKELKQARYEEFVDSIKLTKAFKAGKQAVIDSLKQAEKL